MARYAGSRDVQVDTHFLFTRLAIAFGGVGLEGWSYSCMVVYWISIQAQGSLENTFLLGLGGWQI